MEATPTKYKLDFSQGQWEEIESLPIDLTEENGYEPMTRREWMAVAYMMLGKAHELDAGRFDWGDDRKVYHDNRAWAEECREIAATILDFFKPGDGKI